MYSAAGILLFILFAAAALPQIAEFLIFLLFLVTASGLAILYLFLQVLKFIVVAVETTIHYIESFFERKGGK